jgi:hypothetical protein
MPRKIRLLLLTAAVVFAAAVATLIVFATRPPRNPPLPNPNGYDDFVKAASLVTGDPWNTRALDLEGLREFVNANGESLRLVRLGLSRQSALPADSAMTKAAQMMTELADMKKLALMLAAEGRLRDLDNQPVQAALSYVDTIQFGNEISRGGFIINRLVGVACEAIGEVPLRSLVRKLNSEEARPIIARLQKIDENAVTWEEVRRNENRYARYQLSRNFNPITWVLSWQQSRRTRQRAQMRHNRVVAHVRLHMLELALRCYEADQGHPPATLEQLVPQYLQRVPSDPFSGKPMVYQSQGTSWIVYSVGEDGVDDGGKRAGKPVPGGVTQGDLFYDSPY